MPNPKPVPPPVIKAVSSLKLNAFNIRLTAKIA